MNSVVEEFGDRVSKTIIGLKLLKIHLNFKRIGDVFGREQWFPTPRRLLSRL